ncbi:hypothetical protein BGZ76_011169 [Entomortierella beljakovae]|nr:hypothetical protein BGZ76_011169 [Entomortierella beljakovae]
MRQQNRPSTFILGSVLLTLVLLLTQAFAQSVYEDDNGTADNVAVNNHRAHSPYTNPNNPPSPQLQTNPMAKRSLFPHLFGKLDKVPAKIAFFQQSRKTVQETDESFSSETKYQTNPENNHIGDVDIWQEDEQLALIEPRFPSIDLFDEVDDELLELGEDGILRAIDSTINRSHHRNYPFDSETEEEENERYDQIWMVDEWEEEFDGDMEELMDWAEEDGILNSRFQMDQEERNHLAAAEILGSHRLRDQGSIQNALLNEDEASPFQRLFSESWLF